MRKIIILLLFIIGFLNSSAQNPKYVTLMEQYIVVLDTAKNATVLQDLANKFERIANVEKKEWLPYYYTSYCYAKMKYASEKSAIDILCDKADEWANKADSLNLNNSEVYCLKAQFASERISVNPLTRAQKYGSQASGFREKAKVLDPSNPRLYYLERVTLFYTPTSLGGGKNKAKVCFEKALLLFETFQPINRIVPHWGKASTQ